MEKISVIIPVYNVELYLEKCLKSILNQTYKNLEIIVVNDESPDESYKIIDKYLKQDERIKVINKKNGGLSSARNAGLDIMTGDYVTFLDADDYVDKKFCETLYNNLKKYDADISVVDCLKFTRKVQKIHVDETIVTLTSKEALYSLVDDKFGFIMHTAWGKLYKKNLFNRLRYPIGKLNEDEFIIHHLYHKSKKVVYTNLQLLYYLQRDNSIMGMKFNLKRLDAIEALNDRINLYEKLNYDELRYKTALQINYFIKDNYLKLEKNERKKILKKYIDNSYFVNYSEYKLKEKISNYIYRISPKIFYIITKRGEKI